MNRLILILVFILGNSPIFSQEYNKKKSKVVVETTKKPILKGDKCFGNVLMERFRDSIPDLYNSAFQIYINKYGRAERIKIQGDFKEVNFSKGDMDRIKRFIRDSMFWHPAYQIRGKVKVYFGIEIFEIVNPTTINVSSHGRQ